MSKIVMFQLKQTNIKPTWWQLRCVYLSICDTSHFIYFSYLFQFAVPYGFGSVAWLHHGSPQHASREEHSNPWNKSDFEVTPENALLLFRCGVHSKQVHSQNLIMSFDQFYHCFLPEIHAAYPHPHPPSEKKTTQHNFSFLSSSPHISAPSSTFLKTIPNGDFSEKNLPMFKLCVLVGGFNPFEKY